MHLLVAHVVLSAELDVQVVRRTIPVLQLQVLYEFMRRRLRQAHEEVDCPVNASVQVLGCHFDSPRFVNFLKQAYPGILILGLLGHDQSLKQKLHLLFGKLQTPDLLAFGQQCLLLGHVLARAQQQQLVLRALVVYFYDLVQDVVLG